MVTKKLLTALAITALFTVFLNGAVTNAAMSDPDLELVPEITVDGQTFTLQDVPHDQADTLNYVNIPLRLGEFTAPVDLHLENTSPGIEYLSWTVETCSSHMVTNKYYIEPSAFDTIERTQDDSIEGPTNKKYYQSDGRYDFEVDLTLSEPNCYQITMRGGDEDTDTYNIYDDVYLLVEAGSGGSITADFEMEFGHSDHTIFDEEQNDSVFVLPPEYITLTDTSTTSNTQVASREWTIEWYDLPGGVGGSSELPLSSTDKASQSFSYNLNNVGMYLITLEVTGANGLTYDTSKWVVAQTARNYFLQVLIERDNEGDDMTDFMAKVSTISDPDLQNLYTEAINNCSISSNQNDPQTGAGGLNCPSSVETMFEEYDEGLVYFDVPCTHFPDLSNYNSNDELCMAAQTVKRVDAFKGDGAGSPTEGYLRPDDNINRIEICAVLNRSSISMGGGSPIPESVSTSAYSDLQPLSDNDWRKINAAACTQYEGYPDGTFKPARNINTVETLKVLFGLYDVNVSSSVASSLNQYCPDLPTDEWYAPYLALAFQNDFMEVVDDNCNPGKYLTRGEVIKLMYRMFYEYAFIPLP
jgi:hypothetical protein